MKNFWLHTESHYLPNDELTCIVLDSQENGPGLKQIEAFNLLTNNILKFFCKELDTSDTRKHCCEVCLKKLNRFDANKGKAFNYFTTVIINELRTLWRSRKSAKTLRLTME